MLSAESMSVGEKREALSPLQTKTTGNDITALLVDIPSTNTNTHMYEILGNVNIADLVMKTMIEMSDIELPTLAQTTTP